MRLEAVIRLTGTRTQTQNLMTEGMWGEGPPWEEGGQPSAVCFRSHFWLGPAAWQSPG